MSEEKDETLVIQLGDEGESIKTFIETNLGLYEIMKYEIENIRINKDLEGRYLKSITIDYKSGKREIYKDFRIE